MNQTETEEVPLISIIMPAYNAESTIGESIQSVINQTYTNWELIVVDDGSTDHTSDIVNSFKNSRIYLRKQENGGQSAARNHGIASSKGEFISFLDADDQWFPGKLAAQVALFSDSDVTPGLVHTNYVEFDDSAEYKPKPQKYVKKHQLSGTVHQDLIIHNFIGVLTVMIPRRVLDEVGCFDETLVNSPDWDLWLRITKKYPIAYVDEVLARYRLNPHGLSKNYKSYEKNLWKLLERHLLKEDLPKSKKNYGLWLYYRHMAHGFARNGYYSEALKRLGKAIKTRPLAIANISSLGYLHLHLLKNWIRNTYSRKNHDNQNS